MNDSILLSDITVSHNPRISLRGVLEKFHTEGRAELPEENRKVFVSYMQENFPNIEQLRQSIAQYGLLQQPSVRAFRAKQGDEYVQRYGIILGERRILSYAIKEALTGVPQRVDCNVESRMTVDEAFEKGLAENLDREEMNPVDKAEAFHEMLTVRINPATKEGGKGRPYTLKELAERVKRSYYWVRDHEAIFYLPDELKKKCLNDFQAGKRNLTRYCKLGLQHKSQISGQPEEEVGVDITGQIEQNTGTLLEPKKRRGVVSLKVVQGLFDATPLCNRERLLAFAQVMSLNLEAALVEREVREGQLADRK